MFEKIDNPFILTIFGASGDLAKLKIFPALFTLAVQKRLPEEFFIVGFARSEKTEEEFRKEFCESVQIACDKENMAFKYCQETVDTLLDHVYYFSGKYDDLYDYERFFGFLRGLAIRRGIQLPETHITYFSVPPGVFHPIIHNLALARASASDDIRIVLEKPFGEDEASATELFHFLSRFFHEDQVFLLDHYLGKNSVQSILALRHNNAILNLLLNGRDIASIQISAHETIGVEERTGYFDSAGIIKDMFQSHLTQILAMMTMSIPITADAYSFHREKQSILSALDFSPRAENIYLGQYKGYKEIKGISPHSDTETYFAAKLKIDREAWYGVPIFIRTGKRMSKKTTMVVVEFKRLPYQKSNITPNRLIFELQPDEMIHVKLLNQYGQSSEYHEIASSESIACRGEDCLPEHAALLLDVLKNEKLNFLSFPEIIAEWRITDKILRFIGEKQIAVKEYEPGIVAPEEIKNIFRQKDEYWFELES